MDTDQCKALDTPILSPAQDTVKNREAMDLLAKVTAKLLISLLYNVFISAAAQEEELSTPSRRNKLFGCQTDQKGDENTPPC